MKNRGHKIKFRGGKDANKMLMRKLASNFMMHGVMETTKQKARAAQPIVEKLITKAKGGTRSDNKFILQHVTTSAVAKTITGQIVSQLSNVSSGFTRIITLGVRQTDGADKARLEWAYPVVLSKKEVKAKKKAVPSKETEKQDNKS